VSQDPAVIERGRALAHGAAHCSQCHGDYAREKPQDNVDNIALSGGFKFAMGPMGTMWSSNLTPDGIGKLTDAQLARAIATGVQHDGTLSIFMRYSAANLSAEDLGAVISYLRSLPPVPKNVPRGALTTLGKAAFSFLTFSPDRTPLPAHVPEGPEPSLERGAYLAENVALCIACHTTYDPMTFQPNGPKGGGGIADPSHGPDSDMDFCAPNLTSSPIGITGKLTEDQFIARMKEGRVFPSSTMPWENFGRLPESDVRSIYRYLKALPPVDTDPGPSYRKKDWQPG
jgi:Cytochrome c